jgi:RNA recognition motif. (a.k.a. RRM, RBD, or RNP domain)
MRRLLLLNMLCTGTIHYYNSASLHKSTCITLRSYCTEHAVVVSSHLVQYALSDSISVHANTVQYCVSHVRYTAACTTLVVRLSPLLAYHSLFAHPLYHASNTSLLLLLTPHYVHPLYATCYTCYLLNRFELHGRRLRVGWAQKNTSLFIGNLDDTVTTEDLRAAFRPYGILEEVRVLHVKQVYIQLLHRSLHRVIAL